MMKDIDVLKMTLLFILLIVSGSINTLGNSGKIKLINFKTNSLFKRTDIGNTSTILIYPYNSNNKGNCSMHRRYDGLPIVLLA
jgi:hypothetical protein